MGCGWHLCGVTEGDPRQLEVPVGHRHKLILRIAQYLEQATRLTASEPINDTLAIVLPVAMSNGEPQASKVFQAYQFILSCRFAVVLVGCMILSFTGGRVGGSAFLFWK